MANHSSNGAWNRLLLPSTDSDVDTSYQNYQSPVASRQLPVAKNQEKIQELNSTKSLLKPKRTHRNGNGRGLSQLERQERTSQEANHDQNPKEEQNPSEPIKKEQEEKREGMEVNEKEEQPKRVMYQRLLEAGEKKCTTWYPHYHQLAHLQCGVTRWGFAHTRGRKLLLTRKAAGVKKK